MQLFRQDVGHIHLKIKVNFPKITMQLEHEGNMESTLCVHNLCTIILSVRLVSALLQAGSHQK